MQPEQVLAWQLEGLTQEEIREEVRTHGLASYPDIAFLSALSAAGADAETISVVQHAPGPRARWGLALRIPKPTDYLYEMAGAVLWNDWQHALVTMEAEVEKQPRDADVRLVYAHMLSVAEDWIGAYGAASAAVQLAPESPYAHGTRSTVCYHSHLPECAVREALLFVELKPDDAAGYITLAHARESQGRYDEALAALDRAEKLHAGYAEIYASRGRICGSLGEYEKALRAFERAVQLEGKNPRYQFEFAQLYFAEGYYRQAIEHLKLAKELAPNWPELRLALGNAYLAQEKYEAAAKELHELLEQNPDLEIARELLAKTLRAQGRFEEAGQVLAGPSAELQ
ncbi:MAG TPA: tetratricopeptide repeat protein [Dongiaceae bacterium]|nr:tetratricopeptide repeat protein [Dongiaceae bacterium]